jgi:hypothetical protein
MQERKLDHIAKICRRIELIQHSVNYFGINFTEAMRWAVHVAAHVHILLIQTFRVLITIIAQFK